MRGLVTVWFWLVFGLTAPLCLALGGLLWLVTAPVDPDRRVMHAFISRWTFAYLRLNPAWRIRIHGRERLPRGPSVIVANHQSMADIVLCMGLFHPFKFVSKKSMFSVPLVGWMMTLARYVSVERGKAKSTARMLEDCRRWLRRGVPVLIYPEGTYSGGKGLLPFKRGAFLLAIQEKVPLVPVVIQGTCEVVHEDGPWMNPRATVTMRVLPPVTGEDDEELSARVRGMFEAELRS